MNKPPKKLFYCTYCDKGLSSKYSLKNHEKKLHEDKKSEKCLKNQSENLNEPKTCTICKIEFSKNVHERCFTQYPYPCNFCNSWLKTEELKRVHELTHQLKRCGYCFRDIKTTDFDQHVLTCQNDMVLKQYREENGLSNEQFMEREKLLEPTTQIPHPQPTTPTFSCSKCEKVFLSNNVLKKHIDIVHEAKPKITLQHSEPSGFPVIPSEKDLTNFHSSQLRGILNEVRKHYHNSIIFMDREYPLKAQYYKDYIEKLEKKIEEYENPRILQNAQPFYFEEVIIQPQEMSLQCELCAYQMAKENVFFETFTNRTQIQIQYLCPHQMNIDSTVEFHEQEKPSESTELNSVQLEAEKQFVDSLKGQRKKAFQCKFCEASFDTATHIEEHFNSCHEDIQVEVHEERKLTEKFNKIKRRFNIGVGLLRRLHERSYLQAKEAADLSEKIECKNPKGNNRASQFAQIKGADEIVVIETKITVEKVESTANKKIKKMKRRFDVEVGLLRKLHERSYLQAKEAAAMDQELEIEETGDISRSTDLNVVSSIKSDQMIFEIEETSNMDTTDVDPDVEIMGEHNKEEADISANKKRPAEKADSQEETTKKPSSKRKKGDFICEECKDTFAMKQGLKRHIANVHEKRKPFKCDSCDYTCSLKQSLQRHTSSAHEHTAFYCSVCNQKFTRNYVRNKHEGKCTKNKKQ